MNDLPALEPIRALAPAGFYVAIRVGFAFPMVELNHFPTSWTREYTASGLIVHDPTISWAYKCCGVARWSELGESDTQGVLELAKNHGLNFGTVASCIDMPDATQRTFGLFCRSDREHDDAELKSLSELLLAFHQAYARPANLTAVELETLSFVKNGFLMKEIACALGVSESAIKQRLTNARRKLSAKTGSQAAAKAMMLGVI